MTFNLLTEAWLPVRCRNGEVRHLRPAEIVTGLGSGSEPVEPAWPRPDFDIATYEFLIGLLFAACPPETHADWKDWFDSPPSVSELDEAFAPYAQAFNLDGDGPRFLQDLEPFEEEAKPADVTPIERLMIDAAGGNALKYNKDLQVHRDRYQALGLAAAAMALYALQQFAPSGGKGNRTSMRGGGPLTALALPGAHETAPSLWARIWANVPISSKGPVSASELASAFPWLAATRISSNKEVVTADPADAHLAQAFFGMPRRIRLIFGGSDASTQLRCALSASEAATAAVGFVQKPYGANYDAWRHPLTPYYRLKENSEWLPLHPKPGRFGYRDWTGVVVGSADLLRRPADVLAEFRQRRGPDLGLGAGRVLVAGYATSNMDAVDFLVAEQPLHVAATPEKTKALDQLALQMAAAGEEAMRQVRRAVRNALFSDGAKVDIEGSVFSDVRATFFDATEFDFHSILAQATAEPDALGPREKWLRSLKRHALAIFDDHATPALRDPARDGARIAAAYRALTAACRGTKKKQPLHSVLGLPWSEPSSGGVANSSRSSKSSEEV